MRLLEIIRKREASFEETTADNSLQLLENNNYQVKENKWIKKFKYSLK